MKDKFWYLIIGKDETFKPSILAYGPYKTKEEADAMDDVARGKVEIYEGSHWFNYATVSFANDQGRGRFGSHP